MNPIARYNALENWMHNARTLFHENVNSKEQARVANVLLSWAKKEQDKIIDDNIVLDKDSPDRNPYWEYTNGACRIYSMLRPRAEYESGMYHAYDPTNPYWDDFKAFLTWEKKHGYDPKLSLAALADKAARPRQAIASEMRKFFGRIALKACPFCGGKAKMSAWKSQNEYSAYCTKCGAVPGDYCQTEEEAIAKWNRRKEAK